MVTAPELARRLRVDPKRFRDWLRAQAKAGHPLLGAHVRNSRWEFSEEEAEQLALEFGQKDDQRSRPRPITAPRVRGQSITGPDKGSGHRISEEWMGKRLETLADLLRPNLRAACIGINPSPVSVAAGHYYQGRVGHRFWQRLQQAGAIEAAGTGREDDEAFTAGIGFTDIVKRPTARADGVSASEFRHGRGVLEAKLAEHRPQLLIFTFKKTATSLFGGFEGHGHRPELGIAGASVFVMPGPYERADRVSAALAELRKLLEPR